MTDRNIDILMITYNRPEYTRLSLARLLETCDEHMRVWLWHNGDDEATLDVVRQHLDHPAVYKFHHSRENKKLREPTNWLWKNSSGSLLAKVDDDCLVEPGWSGRLSHAHLLDARIGVVGCCHFWRGDLDLEACSHKIEALDATTSLLRNCWVGGSAYLMKRKCVEEQGLLNERDSWTGYCIRLAAKGWKIGWLVPLLYQEHMDDPRSANSLLKTDADLKQWLPLSARANGVASVGEWQEQLRRSASQMQSTPIDPKHFMGWRKRLRGAKRRVRRIFGSRRQW